MSILTKTERTAAILEGFRGLPGEFYMLKALLCVGHACEKAVELKYPRINHEIVNGESTLLDQHYDRMMIAERMDQLQKGIK